MKNKNIVLIGFMCCGKTTLGNELANSIGYKFLDIDDEIVKLANMNIPQIFENYGECYFRKLENQVVKNIRNVSNAVISCGGGIVKNKENINILKENGIVVFIDANTDKLFKNYKESNTLRPLLQTDNVKQTIENLLNERMPLYLSCCDIKIDVSNFDIAQSINALKELIWKKLKLFMVQI